jgi:hypothetical protein
MSVFCRLVAQAALLACGMPGFVGPSVACEQSEQYGIVIYGGTSGGIAAAVQARRMGKSVVLIEPGRHIGGLSSGGLGATDIGNKAAIGGISREFYRRVAAHYAQPAAWKHESRDEYRGGRQSVGEDTMWTFEPHAAEQIFGEMLIEANVPVLRGERLDLKKGVEKHGSRIVAITMESGRSFRGRMFIDATYEGDLMAKAGVAYTVGREANAQYDETLSGVQTRNARSHQFIKPVDPFIRPGDRSSGLLPGIDPNGPGEEGAADHRVQTYNLRIAATNVPENRRDWPKPADYDAMLYELLLRNFEAGDERIPWSVHMMPNRKTDANNNFAVSTDFIGQNYTYPDGDYATRERIYHAHLSYTQGLFWTLANSPRVPEQIRSYFQQWGPSRDEFTDNDNWPHQLYVREARRMVSDYVMTEHNCRGARVAEDSVGMGAYNMDSHNTQRYVDADGHVRNEGDIQVGVRPYPISYRSIVPRESECSNLLVPVCLSASHISYGSIRMEPVFIVLGQSAATAAAQAIDRQTSVQRLDYAALKERLLADRQVLVWSGPAEATGIDPKKLPGIVLDDSKAKLTGHWTQSSSIGGFVGNAYLHDGNEAKGDKEARFNFVVKTFGRYEVRVSYTPNPNRATNVPVTVTSADGERTVTVNQRLSPSGAGAKTFHTLGSFLFDPDQPGRVVISNRATDGHVIVDAVLVIPAS